MSLYRDPRSAGQGKARRNYNFFYGLLRLYIQTSCKSQQSIRYGPLDVKINRMIFLIFLILQIPLPDTSVSLPVNDECYNDFDISCPSGVKNFNASTPTLIQPSGFVNI